MNDDADPRKRIDRRYHTRGCEDHPAGHRWCPGHRLPPPDSAPDSPESDTKAAEATRPRTDQTKRTEGVLWVTSFYDDARAWLDQLPPPKPGTHESDLEYEWVTNGPYIDPPEYLPGGAILTKRGGGREYFAARDWSRANQETA